MLNCDPPVQSRMWRCLMKESLDSPHSRTHSRGLTAHDSLSLSRAPSNHCPLTFSSQKCAILGDARTYWLDLSMCTPKKLKLVWYSQSILIMIFFKSNKICPAMCLFEMWVLKYVIYILALSFSTFLPSNVGTFT